MFSFSLLITCRRGMKLKLLSQVQKNKLVTSSSLEMKENAVAASMKVAKQTILDIWWNFARYCVCWSRYHHQEHGTFDSTSLIVTEHEFLFQFFNLDQSFSKSDQSGIDWVMYWNTVDKIENENNQKRKLVKLSTAAINFPLQQHTFNMIDWLW